jgi:hypothetical protein
MTFGSGDHDGALGRRRLGQLDEVLGWWLDGRPRPRSIGFDSLGPEFVTWAARSRGRIFTLETAARDKS